MNDVSDGAKAAVAILRECENIGVHVLLGCEVHPRAPTLWFLGVSLGTDSFQIRFTDASVTIRGGWERYAVETVDLIRHRAVAWQERKRATPDPR